MEPDRKPRLMLGTMGDRQVAGLRVFLSLSALLAIAVDPTDPAKYAVLTLILITGYAFYSAFVFVFYSGWTTHGFSRRVRTTLASIDFVLYSLLIALTGGGQSVFLWFYFFLILTVSSQLGPRTGRIFTVLAAAFSVMVAAYFQPGQIEWNRMLRPAILLLMGYGLTYWAQAENDLRRKIELLREVSTTANPRFGVDRTVEQFMKRLLEFFGADSCVFVEQETESYTSGMRCATAWDPNAGSQRLSPPESIHNLLQPILHSGCSVYSGQKTFFGRTPTFTVWDPATDSASARPVEEAAPVAEWLAASSFIATPLRHHEWNRGYLFLASNHRAFRVEDLQFLLQLSDQVMPVLEHIRLVDRMASSAAEDERRRIARSVHDRVIQPYIGLHMGLVGLREKVQSGTGTSDPGATHEKYVHALNSLDFLIEIARDGVQELREYVSDLRRTVVRGDLLMESLLRYAAKFEAVTGIRVHITSHMERASLNDRLAGEIFQMATEALSNVQRHTRATVVHLNVEENSAGVTLRIENKFSQETRVSDFLPKSLAERAEFLGGHTKVTLGDGSTVVAIDIPL